MIETLIVERNSN